MAHKSGLEGPHGRHTCPEPQTHPSDPRGGQRDPALRGLRKGPVFTGQSLGPASGAPDGIHALRRAPAADTLGPGTCCPSGWASSLPGTLPFFRHRPGLLPLAQGLGRCLFWATRGPCTSPKSQWGACLVRMLTFSEGYPQLTAVGRVPSVLPSVTQAPGLVSSVSQRSQQQSQLCRSLGRVPGSLSPSTVVPALCNPVHSHHTLVPCPFPSSGTLLCLTTSRKPSLTTQGAQENRGGAHTPSAA